MNILIKVFNFIKRHFLILFGIIVKEKLIDADDNEVEIDSEGVLFVSIDAHYIIIVFKNSTANAFPAGKKDNLEKGHKIKVASAPQLSIKPL